MDLRSFSADNAGCIHELNYLIDNVPLDRFVLVVDDTTNSSFLERTLDDAWTALAPDSPNRGRSPDEVHRHHYDSETRAVQLLVRRLCGAGALDSIPDLMRRSEQDNGSSPTVPSPS